MYNFSKSILGNFERAVKVNKKQIIVLWICIGLLALVLIFPRYSESIMSFDDKSVSQGSWELQITRNKLCIILLTVCAGFIATFTNKNSKKS